MVVQKNIGRTPKVVRLDQDGTEFKSDVSGREVMVLIQCSGKEIYGICWNQGEIRWMVEVTDIEERGNHQRRRVKGGTDLTPPPA